MCGGASTGQIGRDWRKESQELFSIYHRAQRENVLPGQLEAVKLKLDCISGYDEVETSVETLPIHDLVGVRSWTGASRSTTRVQ